MTPPMFSVMVAVLLAPKAVPQLKVPPPTMVMLWLFTLNPPGAWRVLDMVKTPPLTTVHVEDEVGCTLAEPVNVTLAVVLLIKMPLMLSLVESKLREKVAPFKSVPPALSNCMASPEVKVVGPVTPVMSVFQTEPEKLMTPDGVPNPPVEPFTSRYCDVPLAAKTDEAAARNASVAHKNWNFD